MTFIFTTFVGLTVMTFCYTIILFFITKNDLKRLEKIKTSFMWGLVGVVLIILFYAIEAIIKLI